MLKRYIVATAILGCLSPAILQAAPLACDTVPIHKGVTAHRGNSGEFPENTIPSFESGIAVGADWIELDIYRTTDGKIVVIHDTSTNRVGDKPFVVAKSTYAELLTVDVATDFRKRKGKTLEECPAQTIPLLEEVIRVVMKQNRTHVSIQPKMDCVADAMAIVRKLHAEKMVGFNDGSLKYMSQVKELEPTIPVFWDRWITANIDEDIQTAKQKGFETMVMYYTMVTPENVQKIKAAGITPGAWTVDDKAVMEKLLAMGVERIYTDYPLLLMSIKDANLNNTKTK